MTRTRMDVRNLVSAEGGWPQALVAYERAVGLLRQLDPPNGRPSNPLGWRFLAAMHGLARPDGLPDTSNPLWSNCQHGSWFFLPWHRMYLFAFEVIVQHALQDDTWSLPYWYSLEPGHSEGFVVPAAFRDTSRADNNLFTSSRSIVANSGVVLSEDDLTPSVTDALNARDFTSSDGSASFGSGERSSPSFNGEEVGLLEDTPHGGVHVFVGNDYDSQGRLLRRGWMGSFYTAALDPIFWLHHANMDRLWQVWLDTDPAHRNPTGDPAWANTTFSFPAPGGGLVTWKIGDVLDTVALGYEYETTAPPPGVAVQEIPEAAAVAGPESRRPEMTQRREPKVLGAAANVPLGSGQPVDVEIEEQPVAESVEAGAEAAESAGGRMFLRIEGVKGTSAAPVYEVYINVPAGDSPTEHPELRAGSLSTFGMYEASQVSDIHGGGGKTVVLDMTSVRDTLMQQGRWQPGRLRVVFRPVVPALPEEVAEAAGLESVQARPPDVQASRIAVVSA
jgi:tyrosinase